MILLRNPVVSQNLHQRKTFPFPAQETGVPIAFGVLTTNSHEEAVERAGVGNDNKGWEAAMAAVQLTNVLQGLTRDNGR